MSVTSMIIQLQSFSCPSHRKTADQSTLPTSGNL